MDNLYVEINEYKHHKTDSIFFENIKFELKGGEVNFLIGLSGSGKTTLLKTILGIGSGYSIANINFSINGTVLKSDQSKKLGLIGYVSQHPTLIPWKTIKENLLLPYKLNNKLVCLTEDEINHHIDSVGLKTKIKSKYPHEISLGMQARISFLRTLMYRPKFLFLDELFTGIDTINCDLIANKLHNYVNEMKIVCLSISHDIDRAIQISDNVFILDKIRNIKNLNNNFTKEKILNHLTA